MPYSSLPRGVSLCVCLPMDVQSRSVDRMAEDRSFRGVKHAVASPSDDIFIRWQEMKSLLKLAVPQNWTIWYSLVHNISSCIALFCGDKICASCWFFIVRVCWIKMALLFWRYMPTVNSNTWFFITEWKPVHPDKKTRTTRFTDCRCALKVWQLQSRRKTVSRMLGTVASLNAIDVPPSKEILFQMLINNFLWLLQITLS